MSAEERARFEQACRREAEAEFEARGRRSEEEERKSLEAEARAAEAAARVKARREEQARQEEEESRQVLPRKLWTDHRPSPSTRSTTVAPIFVLFSLPISPPFSLLSPSSSSCLPLLSLLCLN